MVCALSVGVPVNDENIKSLCELVKAKNVVLGELKVKTEGLSPESLDMVRMMLPTVTSPVVEEIGVCWRWEMTV